jgi:hypothetical protein
MKAKSEVKRANSPTSRAGRALWIRMRDRKDKAAAKLTVRSTPRNPRSALLPAPDSSPSDLPSDSSAHSIHELTVRLSTERM